MCYFHSLLSRLHFKQEGKTQMKYFDLLRGKKSSVLRWFVTFLSFCPTSQVSSWFLSLSHLHDRRSIIRVGRTSRFGADHHSKNSWAGKFWDFFFKSITGDHGSQNYIHISLARKTLIIRAQNSDEVITTDCVSIDAKYR